MSWKGWLAWAAVIFLVVSFANKNPAGLGHFVHGVFGFFGSVANAAAIIISNL